MVSACMQHFQRQKVSNSNLMQTSIELLIRFGMARSKLIMFLNRSPSIFGWTILSLAETAHNCRATSEPAQNEQLLKVKLPLLSAGSAVQSSATEHHHSVASAKLYCLATELCVCEPSVHSHTMVVKCPGDDPMTLQLPV